jgi:hypothetical protein
LRETKVATLRRALRKLIGAMESEPCVSNTIVTTGGVAPRSRSLPNPRMSNT